jgi:hypothetical protein
MGIGERIKTASDSIGPGALWISVAVAVIVVLCGTFLASDVMTGAVVFGVKLSLRYQVPWLFVVGMTIAVALCGRALLGSSESMWRSWLLRLGLGSALFSAVLFLVADAQVHSIDYIALSGNGVFLHPAYPYTRAAFAAFALIGQFALLAFLRRRDEP